MSTLPITFKSGDSLSKIASEVLGDYSGWREFADINNLNIFSAIEAGKTLTVPNKETAERRLKDVSAKNIRLINQDIQGRVSEIINSREVRTITKLLGIDTNNILKDLDLSSIADKLSAPTKAERLRRALKSSNYEANIPIFRLIDWVL